MLSPQHPRSKQKGLSYLMRKWWGRILEDAKLLAERLNFEVLKAADRQGPQVSLACGNYKMVGDQLPKDFISMGHMTRVYDSLI